MSQQTQSSSTSPITNNDLSTADAQALHGMEKKTTVQTAPTTGHKSLTTVKAKGMGGVIGGGKNYGPDETAPSSGRNNVYKTPGSGLTTMEAMGPGGRAIGSENGALGESISCFHREH